MLEIFEAKNKEKFNSVIGWYLSYPLRSHRGKKSVEESNSRKREDNVKGERVS